MKNKLKSNKNKTIFQAGDHRSTTRTINGPGTVLCHIYEQSAKFRGYPVLTFTGIDGMGSVLCHIYA
jgi:hypothetical protein